MHEWLMEKGKCLKMEMENKGIDNLTKEDLEEAYYYSKTLKNLMCLEKDGKIVEAMEKAENDDNMDMIETYEDYPERKYYRGQPRDSRGRYMSRRNYDGMMPSDYRMSVDDYNKYTPEQMRDFDKKMGRMYYTESNASMSHNMTRDAREGRSGMSRKMYMETKEMHKQNTIEDKQARLQSLEKHMHDEADDLEELWRDGTPEERSMIVTKALATAQKLSSMK